ncbi:TKL/DRK protein kinase, variant 2 [Aphanomyces invadans]|uniref:TKL/DRK protein kinase, variant 2 n=1 Tax=Aphanomyces invadans TaxID=157072 RepID=A0A024UVF6_9STRA|nr:TKL/DRK protein kinase, variant 2 [Aphanomyces invadans]ETW09648.1 TKL/DRK protein kinase, variant 2 [Aphanomyces invadans]|eukprot:XP_008861066.1 TKL/DRK protein kinase, variant 2 [Aphanomyces invadans]
MGCSNSKEAPRVIHDAQRPLTANEYYPAPPSGNTPVQPSASRLGLNTGSMPATTPVGGGRSAQTSNASEIDLAYAPLQQLKKFWIDPDDCGSSRALKSSYMMTHVGYYQGHPTVIKSFAGFDKRTASVVEKERSDLIKEIRALSKLSHPNIVAFLGFTYTTVDDLKCVTEFMDGGNLRTLLNNPKRELSWRREKLSIALDVASALQYLHSLKPKVMHRNIKAEKVLLTASLSAKLSGYVCSSDAPTAWVNQRNSLPQSLAHRRFGSAREWSYTQTMTRKVGSVEWSAPELLLNEDYNEKIDIYAFGMLLIELDTRELPYANIARDTSNALVTNIITGVVRPTVSPTCPKSISKLVRACLQLDSSLRPSADVIVQILREEQARAAEAVVEKLQIKQTSGSRSAVPTVVPPSIVSTGFDVPHPDFQHLAPLRNQYWIDARDCVVSRQISSSCMSTLLGHFKGDAVVVKMLNLTRPIDCVDQDRKYLVREIVMMAKLAHPNIVTFRGFTFTTQDDLKCVTEFMAGGTVRALLDKKKRALSWDSEKLRLALDVAMGLAYLHGQTPTLMHRNIKASKVLLTPGLGAKLSGFGFARVWTSQETMTAAVGTMEWAAPELLRNEDYSTPADVFSFGVWTPQLPWPLPPHDHIRSF